MRRITYLLGLYAFIWGVSEFVAGTHGQPTWGIMFGALIGETLWQGGKYWLRQKFPATFAKRSTA